MTNEKLKECARLRQIYELKLGRGPYPTSEVSTKRFPEPALGTILLYLADIAGIASHGEKLVGLEACRHDEFRKLVAKSFADRWPEISGQISIEDTPLLCRLMNGTEEARRLIKEVLAD